MPELLSEIKKLTRSTALSPVLQNVDGKRRSGSTPSPRPDLGEDEESKWLTAFFKRCRFLSALLEIPVFTTLRHTQGREHYRTVRTRAWHYF